MCIWAASHSELVQIRGNDCVRPALSLPASRSACMAKKYSGYGVGGAGGQWAKKGLKKKARRATDGRRGAEEEDDERILFRATEQTDRGPDSRTDVDRADAEGRIN